MRDGTVQGSSFVFFWLREVEISRHPGDETTFVRIELHDGSVCGVSL